MRGMRVAIGSDHAALELKEAVKSYLTEEGVDVVDVGPFSKDRVDYPVYARQVAEQVARGEVERGIVVCATGIGVSIAANKVPSIRAALVTDTSTAQLTREHNDTNVLALGQLNVSEELARDIVRIWLETPFSNIGRHQNRIDQIAAIEANAR